MDRTAPDRTAAGGYFYPENFRRLFRQRLGRLHRRLPSLLLLRRRRLPRPRLRSAARRPDHQRRPQEQAGG
ncbi:hypothetical protein [Desulfofundulus kuznetsovii]|uniref:hypothetical protein n=1 Tax=Desulfofundulus kuznetsovii TaxID=58135 RepID=UPI00059C7E1C